jgi:hypothetical protein
MPSLAKARNAIRSGHATFSFLCALAGGVLAAYSSIGAVIGALARIGPWWMPELWFTVFVVICVGDWARDAIPNRPAVYTALLWPSCLVAALTGTSGAKFFAAVKAVNASWGASWQKTVTEFLTVSSDVRYAFTAFSVVLIGSAIVYAHRYAKDTRKAGMPAGPGMSGR